MARTAAATRLIRAACALAIVLVMPVLVPAGVLAATVAGTAITFPSTVTVGGSGVPASVTLRNDNTGLSALRVNRVCRTGDASPPCGSPERGVTVVPACARLVATTCAALGFDPGVFMAAATGSGRLGSACSALTFQVSEIDPASGALSLTPATPGARISLPFAGSECIVDFTVGVLKSPADLDGALAGNQTAHVTAHTQFTGAILAGGWQRDRAEAASVTTVLRAPTSISTTSSPGVVLDAGDLSDRATVLGRVAPTAGATVDFRLYGPVEI